MAELRPFHAVRYNQNVVGDLTKVVTAPYDIISPDAQRAYYQRSPFNAIRLEFSVPSPADDGDSHYARAARQYEHWLGEGVLFQEAASALYLYDEVLEHDGEMLTRRGLIAPVRLARWDQRVVLPHEYTLPKPKADRLDLLRATGVQFSPILAMYDDSGAIGSLLRTAEDQAPIADFTLPPGSVSAAATIHRLREIAEPGLVAALVAAFASLQVYIADGHHRYETALAYQNERRQNGATPSSPSDYAMLLLVAMNDPGLKVWPTHRLLRDVPRTNLECAPDILGQWFVLEERPIRDFHPDALRALAEGMLAEPRAGELAGQPALVALGLKPDYAQRWTLRPDLDLGRILGDVSPVLRKVDVVLLQRLVIERALGLARGEAELGQRISYTRDPDEAASAYANGAADLVFFLEPTSLDQLRSVVQAGERLPQKSTYFYPKPVTGLVFYDENRAF